jgi:hypothetical protein
MVIKRPKAIDGAPACGPQRQRRMAERKLSCPARNDGSAGRGRKLIGAIAHRRSRRQPSFGQIKPSKRPFGAGGTTRIKRNEATVEQPQKSSNSVYGDRQHYSSDRTHSRLQAQLRRYAPPTAISARLHKWSPPGSTGPEGRSTLGALDESSELTASSDIRRFQWRGWGGLQPGLVPP